jgi:hypothetical protein
MFPTWHSMSQATRHLMTETLILLVGLVRDPPARMRPGLGRKWFSSSALMSMPPAKLEKSGVWRPWCRSEFSNAKALRRIAAREVKKWGAARALSKQCADNDNFQNRGNVVPCSFILPSENPPLFAQKIDFRFCTERADFLHADRKNLRHRGNVIATADLQSGYWIRADLTRISYSSAHSKPADEV